MTFDRRFRSMFGRDDALGIALSAARDHPQMEHMSPLWQVPEWVVLAVEKAYATGRRHEWQMHQQTDQLGGSTR